MERRKTLVEHVGLTPIQGFLESESWGFYRGKSTKENPNCCINAKYGKDIAGDKTSFNNQNGTIRSVFLPIPRQQNENANKDLLFEISGLYYGWKRDYMKIKPLQ